MVYADDTTLDVESVKKRIKIIEKYCSIYDIAINANKSKYMIFEESHE